MHDPGKLIPSHAGADIVLVRCGLPSCARVLALALELNHMTKPHD